MQWQLSNILHGDGPLLPAAQSFDLLDLKMMKKWKSTRACKNIFSVNLAKLLRHLNNFMLKIVQFTKDPNMHVH